MVSRQQKKQMLDYLVAKLEGSEEKVRPVTKELIPGIKSNYILLGEDGIVFLADQYYAGARLKGLYSRNKERFPRFGIVFYKDGKTFFRSAAEANYFKKEHELSLKKYDDASMQKMMLLRPEEIFVHRLSDRVGVQYYQPDSPRLEEALASFKFGSVEFDYSHIPSENRFGPVTKESERLFIWHVRAETKEDLALKSCQLALRTSA
ncbi:MAG: hypothetical protein WC979_04200 [Candidatus Pacearchaeota archaeon]